MQTIALENKRGFTLIELVIVIVLIGILAATALPKFANLTTQARTASNQGVAGGLAAAVSIAHAAWIAAGAVTGGTTVTMDGATVSVSSLGWPNGTVAGGAAIDIGGCTTIWSSANAIINSAPLLCAVAGVGDIGRPCYNITGICTYTLATVTAVNTGVAVTPTTSITYNGVTGSVTTP